MKRQINIEKGLSNRLSCKNEQTVYLYLNATLVHEKDCLLTLIEWSKLYNKLNVKRLHFVLNDFGSAFNLGRRM